MGMAVSSGVMRVVERIEKDPALTSRQDRGATLGFVNLWTKLRVERGAGGDGGS